MTDRERSRSPFSTREGISEGQVGICEVAAADESASLALEPGTAAEDAVINLSDEESDHRDIRANSCDAAFRPAEVGWVSEEVVIDLSDDESACRDAGAEGSELAPLSVAEDYAECSVCLEPMHSQPTVVLTNSEGKRVCRHFYHAVCARTMMSAKGGQNCPHCRTSYSAFLPVPDVEEKPQAWFQVVDFDGDGSLDCEEVGDVLKATLPIDCRKLQRMLPALCAKWSAVGRIGYEEMMGPDGLFFYVRDAFRSSSRGGDVPDLCKYPEAWFHYWDEENCGSLSHGELVRAIVKTFGLKTNLRQIRTIRTMLTVMWPGFDPDLGGRICKADFCSPGEGLAQVIIANLGMAKPRPEVNF